MVELTEKQADEYLEKLIKAFKENNAFELRKMSNELIELTLTLEDSRIVDLSLISYALSKLVIKPHVSEIKKWDAIKKDLLMHFKEEKEKEETIKEITPMLDHVKERIKKFDEETGNYVMDIISQGRTKQASRLYALGMSISKAADITKVSKEELLKYVGTTKIHERPFTQSKKLGDRYENAKQVLE